MRRHECFLLNTHEIYFVTPADRSVSYPLKPNCVLPYSHCVLSYSHCGPSLVACMPILTIQKLRNSIPYTCFLTSTLTFWLLCPMHVFSKSNFKYIMPAASFASNAQEKFEKKQRWTTIYGLYQCGPFHWSCHPYAKSHAIWYMMYQWTHSRWEQKSMSVQPILGIIQNEVTWDK